MSREWKIGDYVSVPVPTWDDQYNYWRINDPDDRVDTAIIAAGNSKMNYRVAAFPSVDWTARMWFAEPQDVFAAWVKEVRQEDGCSK